MTYRHFYDKDAAPVPGKSPVQMRVKGGPASSTVQAGVNAALNAFLAGSRISEAPNLQKTVALPDGTTVRMRSRYGQVIVDVVIPPQIEELEEKEDFYGGIVIRPYCLSNETEFLNAEIGTVTAVDFTLPEVTTKQRPAVPSLRPGDPTTHIVVQIKNDVPLDDNPVARGYVKIFRIKDPLVGLHAEVSSSPTRYLVSAKADFSEFYLCGKKLTRVPAMPVTTYTIARVQSYGFRPAKFAAAARSSGLLFVAVDKKLYGLDAGAVVPAWTLLAEATFSDSLQYANDFGDTVSATTAPSGVVTITCSGSNGAGVRSTFTVHVTPGSPRPTLTGAITLMHDGTVPAVNQDVTYEATLTIEGTNFSNTSMGAAADIAEHTVTRIDERVRGVGAMPLITDRFLGGTFPRYTAVGSSTVENWSCSGTFDGWVDADGMGNELPDYTLTFSYERVVTSLGGAAVTTTTYTWDRVQQWLGSSSSVQAFEEVFPAALVRPASDVDRYFYTRKDLHTGKLAWRRGYQRSCSTTQFPTQTGPSMGETIVEGFPGDPAGTYEPTGTQTATYSAATATYELLRPSGAQLVGFDDLPELFGTVPFWAASFSVTTDGTGINKYGNLPSEGGVSEKYTICSGPNETIQPTPLILQTSPFYWINWTGPVGIHRATFPPYDMFSPAPYPGGASFSHTITFDGSTPTSFDIADYVAYFTPSANGEPGFGTIAPGSTIRVGPGSGPQTPQADSGLYCSPTETGDTGRIGFDDHILYDIRTHGFIAWSLVRTENVEGISWVYNATALIGNDVSVVPLRDVIDEWRNLGTPDSASDLKIVFYEAPAEVSLL